MSQIRETLAENLKRLRKERGYNQDKLAELSGLSVDSIKNVEGERAWVSSESIAALAASLDAAPWELLKPEGDQTAQRMSRSALIGEIIIQLGHLDDTQIFGVLKNLEALVLGSLQNKKLVHKNR